MGTPNLNKGKGGKRPQALKYQGQGSLPRGVGQGPSTSSPSAPPARNPRPPPPPRQRQDPELPCGQGDSYLIDAGVRNVVVLQDKPHNVTISPGNAQKV